MASYGNKGTFPGLLDLPIGFAYGDGLWLATEGTDVTLWNINVDNPSDTSGDYGELGFTGPAGQRTRRHRIR